MNIQGGCLCGAVRYTCDTSAIMQFNCHCKDCQRATGGAYAPIAYFPLENVRITGEVRYYESRGGSGNPIRRGFCPACGSQLFGHVDILPSLMSIRAGTLDEPALFQPKVHLFTSHAAPWDHLDNQLMAYAKTPPTGGEHHADRT